MPSVPYNQREQREVSRVEILVHPFYDFYHPSRWAAGADGKWGDLQPISADQFEKIIEKWKIRIREIVSDPSAVLIIVKSGYERNDMRINARDFHFGDKEAIAAGKKKYLERTREEKQIASMRGDLRDELRTVVHDKRLPPEDVPKIKKMERDFYSFVERAMPKRRTFLNLGHFNPRAPLLTDYEIDRERFDRETKRRNLVLSRQPEVYAYGGYTNNCVEIVFKEFMDPREKRKRGRNLPWSHKSKIISSLSVPRHHRASMSRLLDRWPRHRLLPAIPFNPFKRKNNSKKRVK